jgi:2-amino-4-hydroxy-6-hydroxymethyldihydropteridine diphosphokinase
VSGAPVRAFVGLGSNLGDRISFLRAAVAGLPDVVKVSPVYETDPVGGPEGQGPYLNVVVELVTELSASELLRVAGRLEAEAGRARTVRNGPRTLDVDILLYGDRTVSTPELEIPHPRMWQRRFVVAPLAEIAPEVLGDHTVEAAGGDVRRVIDWV